MLGWNTMLELPMPAATRSLLARKLLRVHSPEYVAVACLAAESTQPGGEGRFLYGIIGNRMKAYQGSWWMRLRFACYRSLFWQPRFGWRLVGLGVRCASWWRGREVRLDLFLGSPPRFHRD
jgi:hypothetical protein